MARKDRRSRPAPAAAAPAPLSPGRRRLFWALTLLLPVLFFGLLEGGLRLGGYGASYPLFVPLDEGGTVLMPSREVARRYFSREAGIPTPNPDFFRAEKPANSVRLIVQGGSSAAGFPYYRGASFSAVLRRRLQAAYPDRPVEVINTAMAAVNSYTLLDLADEIIAQQPDAVLVYAGHNEWYGALGAASSQSLGRNPSVVRAFLRFRDWRTIQLIRNALAALRPAPPAGDGGTTLMQRMVGEQEVPLGSDLYRDGLQQFAGNLDLLLARYERAGIPVYIGTLASNERDQRPFVSVDAAPYDPVPDLARLAADSSAATALVSELAARAASDSLSASVAYVYGRALLAAGRPDEARRQLRRARDLDALRFRAPTEMNALIREAAARHGATVVESEAELQRAASAGVVGRESMLEHLHPNLDGYAHLADAFFDALVGSRLVGPAAQPTPPGRRWTLITAADSFGAVLRVDRLTRTWPFRPDEVIAAVEDPVRVPAFVRTTATSVLDGADWYAATKQLGDWYVTQRRWGEALHTRTAVADAYPFLPDPFADRANTIVESNSAGAPADLDQAVADYRRALAIDPGYLSAHTMLGAIALQRRNPSEALPHLEAVAGAPNPPPQALYNLAGAYVMVDRWDDARRVADRLAQANPQYRPFAEAVRRRTLQL